MEKDEVTSFSHHMDGVQSIKSQVYFVGLSSHRCKANKQFASVIDRLTIIALDLINNKNQQI